ncbi:hypothetical protein ACGF0J_30360 [Nonomuraea sp. NPDC047897]|uniref:hypothetical protein n=1 Tax=Nonomuraea sp. NPDC047897 TaxID=3364346 RepID=UPI00371401AE
MLDMLLAVTGCLALVVAVLSGYVRRRLISTPLLALVTGVLFGPVVLGAIRIPTVVEGYAELHELARVLLAISVMAAGAVTGEPAERTLSRRTRQLLSLESGANDGLALPLVLGAIAITGAATGGDALLRDCCAWTACGPSSSPV